MEKVFDKIVLSVTEPDVNTLWIQPKEGDNLNNNYTIKVFTNGWVELSDADIIGSDVKIVLKDGTTTTLQDAINNTNIIPIDNVLNTTSTNPVQNKVINDALSNKITNPEGAVNGYVLTYDAANGIIWRPVTATGVPDTEMSDTSEQAVENKVIKAYIDSNILNAVNTLDVKKANKDGYYSQMTVGLADNLISPDGVVNNEPYIYRTTAGSTSVSNGNAEIQKIEGNTLNFNQLVSQTAFNNIIGGENTVEYNDGVATLMARELTQIYRYSTISQVYGKVPIGHKALVMISVVDVIQPQDENIKIMSLWCKISHNGNSIAITSAMDGVLKKGIYYAIDTVGSTSANWLVQFGYTFYNPTTIQTIKYNGTDGGISIDNINIFDLTQMFGAGNEPATVEEFEKLFPNDYYEYNEGEILSTNINSLKSVGFNQYNHTTGKADVIKGNQYQITGTYTAITYSDSTAITPDGNGLFTPTKNDTLTITGGNNTNTCVHLTWSGYRNGDYEPYEEHTISIPISSIKDANNNVLFPDGLCSAGNVYDEITSTKAIKRIGKVDLGSLTWNTWRNVDNCFSNNTLNKPSYNWNTIPNLILKCAEYQTDLSGYNIYGGQGNKNIAIDGNNIVVKNINCSTTEQIKTALDGVYLYYKLATPIEVDFATTPQDFGTVLNLTYKEDDFGTEEFIKETDKETAPVKASTFYMINLRDKIRNIDGSTDAAALMIPSLDELLTTLGTALNGTLTKSWNSTNNKYDFTFTPNSVESTNE